jgi:hypothetical protein
MGPTPWMSVTVVLAAAHRGDDPGAQCHQLPISVADLGQELGRGVAAGDPDRVARSDPAPLGCRPISRQQAGKLARGHSDQHACSRQIDWVRRALRSW